MPYFSGQGRVYVGARDQNGQPLGLSYVGNVPELKVSLSVETLEHQESSSGQRLTDLQLIKTKKGEFSCTLEELIAVNLGLALYGTTIEQTSGVVTGEALPNPLTVGSLYLLAHQNVSALEISDASANPQTLAAEQYRLNAKYGSLEILDKTSGGPFVEPFSVDYDYVHARHTTEAYDAAAPVWLDKVETIESDLVQNDAHAQVFAARELIYRAHAAQRYGVTIVDDLRLEPGDILALPDGSRLYVTGFTRDLTRDTPACLEVEGFVA